MQPDEIASFDPMAGNRIATAIFYVSSSADQAFDMFLTAGIVYFLCPSPNPHQV